MEINEDNQNHSQNGVLKEEEEVVVVVVPFPAQGHLNQLLQLSRLIFSYDIPVHYVGTASHNRQAKLRVHGWNPLTTANIHFHNFEIPSFLSPPPDPSATCKFPSHMQPCFDCSKHLRQPLSQLLRNLSSRVRKVIVIHDSMMGSVIQEVRLIPNIESYSFHSVSAFTVYLYILETMGNSIEANDVFPKDIPSLEDCFTKEFLDSVASEYDYQKFNSGNVYNSCRVLEDAYLDLLDRATMESKIKNWALGPFNPVKIPKFKGSNSSHFCFEWLDKQAPNSVIYVSFGTTTALNDEQIKELALGLKQSNQKFIWVVRDADKGDVFDGEVRSVELPRGYEDSVKDMGLIVRDWAPQLEILGHPATGGFLSHCGWNSCMESISMGVPIGAWPMHSDQPRNAVLITQVLKLGIVVRDWAERHETVTSEVVENVVKRLMASKEGDEMRKRAAEIGGKVRESMDEAGVSRMELDSFVAHITSSCSKLL
ncbi:zeatin O-glucosyltransferase-like [Pistacia vera]|uniref:zeatin O-glucosyltransferase-like n=1 Tax=Pistacia vera TaxID=55513 RepID=UPI001263705B|nr:zeatin O-glucosyltransferase-like [Pistacia vera]